MAKLTAKQQKFVDEYLIDLNATQAAIRAGYKKTEYTDTNANKLLENTRIREAVDKSMAERSRRTGINQDRVIQELARIAFVNPQNVITVSYTHLDPDALLDLIELEPTEALMKQEENKAICKACTDYLDRCV